MATFQVNEYDIDVNSKRLINSTSGGYGLEDADKPRLYSNESVVWALNCFDRTLTASAFAESDTWELWVDIDYDHTLYEGVLNGALTTASATTSIVIDYTVAPTANTIGDTGGLLLRDDNGNRERVAYTAVTGAATTQATYTVNKVLEYPYDDGDWAANEDPLMIGSDNDDFNVVGDWSGLDVVNGKISAKVDCTSYRFQQKVQAYIEANPSANEVPVWVQINKYTSGQSTPSVILQDLIYAKPSVRDIENASNITGPNWSQADARYLKVYALTSPTTEALVSTDLINILNASTSATETATMAQLTTLVSADDVQGKSNLTTQYRGVFVNAAGEVIESSSIKTNADGDLICTVGMQTAEIGIGIAPSSSFKFLMSGGVMKLQDFARMEFDTFNGNAFKIVNGATVEFNVNTSANFVGVGGYESPTGSEKFGVDGAARIGGDLTLATDSDKILLGTAQDASMYYDGTNLVVNPKEVGSGKLSVLGDLSANVAHSRAFVSTAAATSTITAGVPRNLFENATIAEGDVASNDFTVDNTGKQIDYTGTATKNFNVECVITMTSSVSNQTAMFYIAKNGTFIANSKQERKIGTGSDKGNATVAWDLSLASTDTVEVFCDLSINGAITAESAFWKINELIG